MKAQIDKKQLVGRVGDQYYICDYVFRHGDGFKGATGIVLVPVSEARRDEETDPNGDYTKDRFEDCWRQAVQAGSTTKGLDAYVEEILSIDGDEAVYDMSGYAYWDMIREAIPELTEEAYPVFECVGGGRCFDKDMKFDEVYNQALLDEIAQYESN